eukprot:1159451-Pelagomonas_calceolata.AAC.1
MPAALRLWRMLGVHTMQILDIMRDSRLLRPPAAQAVRVCLQGQLYMVAATASCRGRDWGHPQGSSSHSSEVRPQAKNLPFTQFPKAHPLPRRCHGSSLSPPLPPPPPPLPAAAAAAVVALLNLPLQHHPCALRPWLLPAAAGAGALPAGCPRLEPPPVGVRPLQRHAGGRRQLHSGTPPAHVKKEITY